MIELNDEILNKYIDGELDQASLNEVREQLKNSENDRMKLAMFQKVHGELGKLKTFEPSKDFTSMVMSRVQKEVKSGQKDRFFMLFILSVFGVIICGVLSYILVLGFQHTGGNAQDVQNISNYVNYINDFSGSIKNILSPKNISVFGSILSFGVIISGYLFFESQRQTRRNLSKLH